MRAEVHMPRALARRGDPGLVAAVDARRHVELVQGLLEVIFSACDVARAVDEESDCVWKRLADEEAWYRQMIKQADVLLIDLEARMATPKGVTPGKINTVMQIEGVLAGLAERAWEKDD
jgi:hypothetical protein